MDLLKWGRALLGCRDVHLYSTFLRLKNRWVTGSFKLLTVASVSVLNMFTASSIFAIDQVDWHNRGVFFSSVSGGSSLLHNSVAVVVVVVVGGTTRSARDHLIKFLLLQTQIHVHAVMLTQEADAKSKVNPTTQMNEQFNEPTTCRSHKCITWCESVCTLKNNTPQPPFHPSRLEEEEKTFICSTVGTFTTIY